MKVNPNFEAYLVIVMALILLVTAAGSIICDMNRPARSLPQESFKQVTIKHVVLPDGEMWSSAGEGIAVFDDGSVCNIHNHKPDCTHQWVPAPEKPEELK